MSEVRHHPGRWCALPGVLACAASVVLGCQVTETGPATPREDLGSADGGMPGPCMTEADVLGRVFEPSCSSSRCHDGDRPKADLDLLSPGLGARLMTMRSVHPRCADRVLLAPGSPEESFLLDKLLGTHGSCGEPMPPVGEILPSQRRCVAEWVQSLGANP